MVVAFGRERRENRIVSAPVQRERLEGSAQRPSCSVQVGRIRRETGERLADGLERGECLYVRLAKRRLVPRSLGLAAEPLERGSSGLALGLEFGEGTGDTDEVQQLDGGGTSPCAGVI
jgi:hypothetical protein